MTNFRLFYVAHHSYRCWLCVRACVCVYFIFRQESQLFITIFKRFLEWIITKIVWKFVKHTTNKIFGCVTGKRKQKRRNDTVNFFGCVRWQVKELVNGREYNMWIIGSLDDQGHVLVGYSTVKPVIFTKLNTRIAFHCLIHSSRRYYLNYLFLVFCCCRHNNWGTWKELSNIYDRERADVHRKWVSPGSGSKIRPILLYPGIWEYLW